MLAVAAVSIGTAPASAAVSQLPDLVSDPPVGGNAPTVYDDGQGDGPRLLLRMDGFVHNRGPGALEIRGSDPVNGVMGTVRQRIYDDGGGFTDLAHAPAPTLIYETNDDHRHWHLRDAMRYSLWSQDKTAEVAPSQKAGFCLVDSEPVEAPANATPVYTVDSDNFCQSDNPTAASVTMGISAGWRDLYSYVLAFQWIDISDVAPGSYWLRADTDPDGVIAEADEVNPGAYSADPAVVEGYRANPVAVGEVAAQGATAITLDATQFNDGHLPAPGPREFQVVTPPAGGTLDEPAGTWFSASQLHYTPNPGFSGPDTFTVAARDSSTPYPLHPRSAAVTLTVAGAPGDGVLGISGAPESVATSSETQLSATGPGVAQGVTWSVNGIAGGSAFSGTISSDGIYRAPSSPPSAGGVVVSARSATGATGQASFRVAKAPRPRPAPTVKAPPVPSRGLSRIRLGREKRSLIAVVSSAQSGRVRFTARSRGKRFGSCSMTVRKGGSATCKVRIPAAVAPHALVCLIPRTHALHLPGVVVTATLTRAGKVVATRHATAH